jgi:hypothetical protein
MKRALVKSLLLALSLGAAPACGGDGGSVEQAALGISATKGTTVEGPVGCEKLPLLRGSRAISRYVVDEQFDVVVDSTPEQARVSFVMDGEELASPFVVSRLDLDADFLQEVSFTVEGLAYTVRVVSGCDE